MKCDKAPFGWRCKMAKGHEGPCAAEPRWFWGRCSWYKFWLPGSGIIGGLISGLLEL
jgi:hypothetical protein